MADFMMNRRTLLQSSAWLILAYPMRRVSAFQATPQFVCDPFSAGVASGDPTSHGIVLWTRLVADANRTQEWQRESVAVEWQISSDESMALKYTVLQRLTYSSVVFVFLPVMILSGLAMSPAVTALVPIVEIFGGYQSSRTIHFFVTNLLVLFVIVHVTMVYRSGFWNRTRAMVTGTIAAEEKL